MWQRHTVSTLAATDRGWQQRANFLLAGSLYLLSASGIPRAAQPKAEPRAVPIRIGGAGLGLIGSGIFVTDPVAGYPPRSDVGDGRVAEGVTATREGGLHTLCAIPIFFGIPLAAQVSAIAAIRERDSRWATYSFGSSMAMVGSFVAMGMAFSEDPRSWWKRRTISTRCYRIGVRMGQRTVAPHPRGSDRSLERSPTLCAHGTAAAPQIRRCALSRRAWRTHLSRAWHATSTKRCG